MGGLLTVVCSECMTVHDREVERCGRCGSVRLAIFNREQRSRPKAGAKRPGRGFALIPAKIRYRRSTTQDAILILLESGEILTGPAVAKRLRIPWPEALENLAELARRGEIEQSDGGVKLYAIF